MKNSRNESSASTDRSDAVRADSLKNIQDTFLYKITKIDIFDQCFVRGTVYFFMHRRAILENFSYSIILFSFHLGKQ